LADVPDAVTVRTDIGQAVRIIRVDHTGPEPVLVIDFGDGEERWSMDG
jgi:hypothetical protein